MLLRVGSTRSCGGVLKRRGYSTQAGETTHIPVLKNEVLKLFTPVLKKSTRTTILVDATFGGGGHTKAVLESFPKCIVYAFDRDKTAFERASEMIRSFNSTGKRVPIKRLIPVHAKFSQMRTELTKLGVNQVDGILMDVGVSSFQLDEAHRGFSFRHDGPLDMRMDQADSSIPTAADLLKRMNEQELSDIIWQYGEDRHSRRIAEHIKAHLQAGKDLSTTLQLAELIRQVAPQRTSKSAQKLIDPATRTFQALRICVNKELDELQKGLVNSLPLLKPGARLAVISFHTLEDRLVKEFFSQRYYLTGIAKSTIKKVPQEEPEWPADNNLLKEIMVDNEKDRILDIVTKKPILPSAEEVEMNNRSRSAKLRCAQRIQPII